MVIKPVPFSLPKVLRLSLPFVLFCLTSCANSAPSQKAAETYRIYTGLGVVTGLKGTGDGSGSPALKRIAASTFDKRTIEKIGYENMAAVELELRLPRTQPPGSVSEKASVSIIGPARSLEGGTLADTSLVWDSDRLPMVVVGGKLVSIKDESGAVRWYCSGARLVTKANDPATRPHSRGYASDRR
ncbi:MAG TPA: flagellar basal body P-ring protein FlgI [Tepidisphaeraceae bacterium]|jgi:hypothetical protein|nr:flagellar basal body P-ring protein FlgI [Tepidisphaeraceae bacterium]